MRMEERDYFTDYAVLKEPYEYFEAVRAQGPVHTLPHRGVVVVTGYAEALEVLNNRADFSSAIAPQGPAMPLPFAPQGDDLTPQIEAHRNQFIGGDLLVAYDDRQHSMSRSILSRLFTPSRLKANEAFIREYADELVRNAVAQGGCELINEIATPFVTLVVADLLGVPADDRKLFMERLAVDARADGSLYAQVHLGGGGFLWVWADEGVRRSDQGGRIDSQEDFAPDGIVGPHGEKEGSYFTVKELWSPVQVENLALTPKALTMQLSNRYSFTNLREIQFKWELIKLPGAATPTGEREVVLSGQVQGPELAAGASKQWDVPIKLSGRADFNVAHLSAFDGSGQHLWTWSVRNDRDAARAAGAETFPAATIEANAEAVKVVSAPFELTFSRDTVRDTCDGLQVRHARTLRPPISAANAQRLAAGARFDLPAVTFSHFRAAPTLEDSARSAR